MLVDPDDGDRVVIRGRVSDVDGNPIAGAVLDCWQNVTARFLRCQQPEEQTPENLRGIYRTFADGTSRSARFVRCRTPFRTTGRWAAAEGERAGLDAAGAHPVWLKAPGFKDLITHVFDVESEYLDDDAVFGCATRLITILRARRDRRAVATFDFVLDRAA